jgi:hypothetical protein
VKSVERIEHRGPGVTAFLEMIDLAPPPEEPPSARNPKY